MEHAYLEIPSKKATKVSKRSLINTLHHAHFNGTLLWLRAQGSGWTGDQLIKISTGLCQKDEIICQSESDDLDLKQIHTAHIVIEEGKRAMVIPTTVVSAAASSITLKLPETAYTINTRRALRLKVDKVQCEVSQDGTRLSGNLMDFSVQGFRMALDKDMTASGLDLDKPVQVRMTTQAGVVFEGECQILRLETRSSQVYLILLPPAHTPAALFPMHSKQVRTTRLHLTPTPKAFFTHPLSDKQLAYELLDITASGFSLSEHIDDTLLVPGLIIPRLTLLFDGDLKMDCQAQVLHTCRHKDSVRVGFQILDMEVNTFAEFFNIIINAIDKNANMGRLSDMDTLWEHLFECGFIYPKKYENISKYRDTLKETYRKLYQDSKDIFFNLTLQDTGRLYGHEGLIRGYQRTWVLQHLSARPMHGKKRAGLEVLRHLFTLYDASYRLPSIKLDYMLSYFRPTNSFVMYFLGNFYKITNDPQICSMDLASYHYVHKDDAIPPLPEGWSLDDFTDQDLAPLQTFYRARSGGLLLDAFGIGKSYPDEEPLEQLYARQGLLRQTKLYALRHQGSLKAMLIVDTSDIGLNLSDLLNCIKVIVIDDAIPWGVMQAATHRLTEAYTLSEVPVLTYPADYLKKNGIGSERSYYLLIHNSHHAEKFVTYVHKTINVGPIRLLIRAIQAKLARSKE